MTVEFKAVEAIDSLVALLRVADDSAVHCWEQDEPFPPGIFPGLILLARFAADRAGEEFKQAVVAAEVSRWNKNLQGERDELQQKILQVAAERDAANEQHAIAVRRYDAEVERRLALEKQVAELTEKLGELPDEEDEPFPEPYQWQVGDVVESDGESPRLVITRDAKGWVFFNEIAFGLPQFEWEKLGWGLYSKASDFPNIPPMTPQQMADFAAVMEQVSDSVGADGEGQP